MGTLLRFTALPSLTYSYIFAFCRLAKAKNRPAFRSEIFAKMPVNSCKKRAKRYHAYFKTAQQSGRGGHFMQKRIVH